MLVASKASDTEPMTASASEAAIWSEEAGVPLVLSMLGGILGSLVVLVAVEVVGGRDWR